MRKTKFNWEAFSSKNRMKIIEEIKNTINKYGYIVNFNMFSDLALSLSAEVDENQIENLYNDLEKHTSMSKLDRLKLNLKSKKEAVVFLNILFARGTGDVSHIKPMVDG
ncbi:hypothetical protein [Flavicella sp.]|uniref:hypothetical protein n=1 Tax=Flavicella sp. TaxID=2957742 RepID=UPI0026110350|nr:hypothetical protein [Flavicella sp.]MDG1805677.1 hypothetical protein [Flavicella sp.]MDG2280337.1 hypothetical protein [Flavicella sp.]